MQLRGAPKSLAGKRLSPRELVAYELIGEGLTDKEIATRMEMTVLSAKQYSMRVRTKTGLNRFRIIHECAHRQERAAIYAGFRSMLEAKPDLAAPDVQA